MPEIPPSDTPAPLCCETPAPRHASVQPGCASAELWPCNGVRLFPPLPSSPGAIARRRVCGRHEPPTRAPRFAWVARSEEHTSELQSPYDLVCRLLLEKKKKTQIYSIQK